MPPPMESSFLSPLNNDLNVLFLSHWLDVRSLVALDTAFSSHTYREYWMTLLHAMRSSAIDRWGHSYSSLIWLTKRRICTSRLYMKSDARQMRECDILDLETKNIHNLGLDSCYRLTDQGMSDIIDRCFKLRCIDIRSCMQITDVGVSALGYRCHQLQSVNLSFCTMVTDAGISALGAGCGQLQSIDLTCCDEVTDSGVSALNAGCG